MGIFDLFKSNRSNVELAGDRIWLTKAAKFAGLARQARNSLTGADAPDAILLAAHFPDCLDELRARAESAALETGRVMVTSADALSGSAGVGDALGESQTIGILVAERHPLRSRDEAIADFARSFPCRCRLVFHVSLEDALLQGFAGDWVRNLLERLGMTEDEAIESEMVARRLKQAQEKLENNVVDDLSADSAEEWMEQNCRR
jgi:hypothetical protein